MKKLKFLVLPLSALLLTACLEPKLPKCDSREVKSLVTRIIKDNLNSPISHLIMVKLDDIKEISFNKDPARRECRTNVEIPNKGEGWISYKIYWNGSKYERTVSKAEFLVEITGGGDY